MPFINLPENLQRVFQKIDTRLLRLENSQRFSVPVVATDPTSPRNGDMWINSTSNTLKVKDSAGTTRTITWV
jgi:hypothetical protein